jgi:hypothetical protein
MVLFLLNCTKFDKILPSSTKKTVKSTQLQKIDANKVPKGAGTKMYKSLVGYLKSFV